MCSNQDLYSSLGTSDSQTLCCVWGIYVLLGMLACFKCFGNYHSKAELLCKCKSHPHTLDIYETCLQNLNEILLQLYVSHFSPSMHFL